MQTNNSLSTTKDRSKKAGTVVEALGNLTEAGENQVSERLSTPGSHKQLQCSFCSLHRRLLSKVKERESMTRCIAIIEFDCARSHHACMMSKSDLNRMRLRVFRCVSSRILEIVHCRQRLKRKFLRPHPLKPLNIMHFATFHLVFLHCCFSQCFI